MKTETFLILLGTIIMVASFIGLASTKCTCEGKHTNQPQQSLMTPEKITELQQALENSEKIWKNEIELSPLPEYDEEIETGYSEKDRTALDDLISKALEGDQDETVVSFAPGNSLPE